MSVELNDVQRVFLRDLLSSTPMTDERSHVLAYYEIPWLVNAFQSV